MHIQSCSIYQDTNTNLKIDVKSYGEGHNKLIVIPGGPALKKTYLEDSVLSILPTDFEVYFLSTPGHEMAWNGDAKLSLRDTVNCYANFIQSHTKDSLVWGMGHSMGCWTLAALSKKVNIFSNLFIAPCMEQKIPALLESQFAMIRPQVSSRIEYLEKILCLYFQKPDVKVIQKIIDHQAINTEIIYDLGTASLKDVLIERDKSVNDWAIFGENDPLANETLKEAKFISTMTNIVQIPNTKHFPMLEDPNFFSSIVKDWLNSPRN